MNLLVHLTLSRENWCLHPNKVNKRGFFWRIGVVQFGKFDEMCDITKPLRPDAGIREGATAHVVDSN